jgi:hypothetical protein
MKNHQTLISLLIVLGCSFSGFAQERIFIPHSLEVSVFTPPPPPVEKEIPDMRADAAITVPSKASRSVTLVRGEASTLPDLPVPVAAAPTEAKALTQEDLDRMADQRRHMLQIGATIYDHRVSVAHWQHPDTGEAYEAVCGFDLGLLEGIGQFIRDGETYSIMLPHTFLNTTGDRASKEAPDFSRISEGSITILKGNPKDPVGTATITLLQELIASEKPRLVAYQADRLKFQQAAAEWQKAHPPVPRDETFWLKPHRGSRYLANPKPEASAK